MDIEIRFESYYHGDEDAFDGPGGEQSVERHYLKAPIARSGGSRLLPRVRGRRTF